MKSWNRNQKPTLQTRKFSWFSPSASKPEIYLTYLSHQSWKCHHQSPFQAWRLSFLPYMLLSRSAAAPSAHIAASWAPPAPLLEPLGRGFCSTNLVVFLSYFFVCVCGERDSDFKTCPVRWPGEQDWAAPISLPAILHLPHPTCCLQPVPTWHSEGILESLDLCIFLLQLNLNLISNFSN